MQYKRRSTHMYSSWGARGGTASSPAPEQCSDCGQSRLWLVRSSSSAAVDQSVYANEQPAASGGTVVEPAASGGTVVEPAASGGMVVDAALRRTSNSASA